MTSERCEACDKSDMEHKNSMPPVFEVREYHHALLSVRAKERDEALELIRQALMVGHPNGKDWLERARRILAEGKK